MLKPWVTSVERKLSVTGSPFFTVISFGSKENLLATTSMRRVLWARPSSRDALLNKTAATIDIRIVFIFIMGILDVVTIWLWSEILEDKLLIFRA